MLFIWTNDGGPLQYIGLLLFLMQVIVPHMQLWLEDQDAKDFIPSFAFRDQHLPPTSATTPPTTIPEPVQNTFPWEIAVIAIFVAAWIIVRYPENAAESYQEQHRQHQPNGGGSNNERQNTQQQAPNEGGTETISARERIRRFLVAVGFERRAEDIKSIIFFFVALFVLWGIRTGAVEQYGGVSGFVLHWIPYMHQYTALAAIGFEVYRRLWRMEDGNRTTYIMRQQQKAKMERMMELVKQVPLETFVPQEEDQGNVQSLPSDSSSNKCYSSTSIAKLKEMLQRRGVPQGEIDSFVDKQNLVDRLLQCRQYADSCCICFEPYEEGEPLRILPRCHHELHVECFEKWVLTFANHPIKLSQEPCCPLCKDSLQCK
ncbi:ring finger domain containing protein [Nitzschia inconspicua]|uniref:Ring finger domain containing protein n=1 Tax=Nitzschia inconspicua TaxID=303405 RepID=A0A9K3PIJ2_9STRA|nr:ring finger domain containing protein [Nitzschia inconspicua]